MRKEIKKFINKVITFYRAGMASVKNEKIVTYVFNDDELSNSFNARVHQIKEVNSRRMVEIYCKQIVKETLEKDNYLISYNQAMPYAVQRLVDNRNNGLLDDFYNPVNTNEGVK